MGRIIQSFSRFTVSGDGDILGDTHRHHDWVRKVRQSMGKTIPNKFNADQHRPPAASSNRGDLAREVRNQWGNRIPIDGSRRDDGELP